MQYLEINLSLNAKTYSQFRVDPTNLLAITLLDLLGNKKPTQTQIDLVESLLKNSPALKKIKNFFFKAHSVFYLQ
jgi:hypothetical protein